MSRDIFISTIKSSIGELSPVADFVEHPERSSGIADALRKADLWLATATVSDFDEKDFADLPDEQRTKLADHVGRFRSIAACVPPKGPATPEDSAAARRELLAIASLVLPDIKLPPS